MSRQAQRALDAVLGGAERIDRSSAVLLLEFLGFRHRGSGSHTIWSHPRCQAKVNWPHHKKSKPVWGYEMNDLRKAVKVVLDSAKDAIRKDTNMSAMKAPEKINIPANVQKMMAFEKEVLAKPSQEHICISVSNFPDVVAEMVYAYEQREMSGKELANLLNESGYRTATGLEFRDNTVTGLLVYSSAYKKMEGEYGFEIGES